MEKPVEPESVEFYRQMSTYEISDLYYTTRDSTVFVVSTFLTVLFAYLAVAFLAAKKLSTFEVVGISLIYSVFTLFLFSGVYASMLELSNIQQFLSGTKYEIVDIGFPAFLVVCWASSLMYMYQRRREADT